MAIGQAFSPLSSLCRFPTYQRLQHAQMSGRRGMISAGKIPGGPPAPHAAVAFQVIPHSKVFPYYRSGCHITVRQYSSADSPSTKADQYLHTALPVMPSDADRLLPPSLSYYRGIPAYPLLVRYFVYAHTTNHRAGSRVHARSVASRSSQPRTL